MFHSNQIAFSLLHNGPHHNILRPSTLSKLNIFPSKELTKSLPPHMKTILKLKDKKRATKQIKTNENSEDKWLMMKKGKKIKIKQ